MSEQAVRLDTWWSRNDPGDIVSPAFVVGSSTLGKLMDMMDKGAISLTNVKFDSGLGPLDIRYLYCRGLYVSEGTFLNVKERLQATGDIHLKSDIVVEGDIFALTVIVQGSEGSYTQASSIEGEMIDCRGNVFASGDIRVNKNITCNKLIAGGKISVKGLLTSKTDVVSANDNCEGTAIRARDVNVKGRFIVGNNDRVSIPSGQVVSTNVVVSEESIHTPSMRYVVRYGRSIETDPVGICGGEII